MAGGGPRARRRRPRSGHGGRRRHILAPLSSPPAPTPSGGGILGTWRRGSGASSPSSSTTAAVVARPRPPSPVTVARIGAGAGVVGVEGVPARESRSAFCTARVLVLASLIAAKNAVSERSVKVGVPRFRAASAVRRRGVGCAVAWRRRASRSGRRELWHAGNRPLSVVTPFHW
uniref:Uncharacterized protein n=1 Tax=Oryza sativa subsp. japonica TaxID=39947 RepID=Q53RK0_ORYSJ|nr:hypothetical protein [Oryza sativa Japonica Group]ABF98496.1 hypothetical protein LOC_Os03g50190 [Oryza sativa Japonica Group]